MSGVTESDEGRGDPVSYITGDVGACSDDLITRTTRNTRLVLSLSPNTTSVHLGGWCVRSDPPREINVANCRCFSPLQCVQVNYPPCGTSRDHKVGCMEETADEWAEGGKKCVEGGGILLRRARTKCSWREAAMSPGDCTEPESSKQLMLNMCVRSEGMPESCAVSEGWGHAQWRVAGVMRSEGRLESCAEECNVRLSCARLPVQMIQTHFADSNEITTRHQRDCSACVVQLEKS